MMEKRVHVWEMMEIVLAAQNRYTNPYTDAEVWVRLRGPNFDKKVCGFWDGGSTFKVRVLATAPGEWRWSSSSMPSDPGLSGKTGAFVADEWSETAKDDNPNRRGFLRASPNGHAFTYADGTPFFYLADTWWACSTWRYPFKGASLASFSEPGTGFSFEEAVQFRKTQGYNGVAMIASYPSWQSAGPATVVDDNGIVLRAAWDIDGACARMPDESGNQPFLFPGKITGHENTVPDFDRINPDYFQSLDRKMEYLSNQGFVPFFETVRRDHAPSWKNYYDWPGSFFRYNQYLAARYGCCNLIFSGVHMDNEGDRMLKAREWNELFTAYYSTFGALPFEQPQSTNIVDSTYRLYGHRDSAPWLTLHGVGNRPRDHRTYALTEEMFRLPEPYPVLNNEPYYPHSQNPQAAKIEGDHTANTRAAAWGSVFNGALAGHVYGTQGYYVATGEPEQDVPYIWDALAGRRFLLPGSQMAHLKEFMLSEETTYQDLVPHRSSLVPNCRSDGLESWYLSGWSSLMRTPDAALVVVYFEVKCPVATIRNLPPSAKYAVQWFDPRSGEWIEDGDRTAQSNPEGDLHLGDFPDGETLSKTDWALKLTIIDDL